MCLHPVCINNTDASFVYFCPQREGKMCVNKSLFIRSWLFVNRCCGSRSGLLGLSGPGSLDQKQTPVIPFFWFYNIEIQFLHNFLKIFNVEFHWMFNWGNKMPKKNVFFLRHILVGSGSGKNGTGSATLLKTPCLSIG